MGSKRVPSVYVQQINNQQKRIKQARTSLEDIAHSSQHVAIFSDTRVTFIVCMCSLPLKGNATREWLSASCNPVPENKGVPIKLKNSIILI